MAFLSKKNLAALISLFANYSQHRKNLCNKKKQLAKINIGNYNTKNSGKCKNEKIRLRKKDTH